MNKELFFSGGGVKTGLFLLPNEGVCAVAIL